MSPRRRKRSTPGLAEAECVLARRLLLRMVAVGGRRARRARAAAADAAAPPTGHLDRAGEVYSVLERFVDRRLVTLDGDGARITHEALLTAWPRLRGWIDADRAGGARRLRRLLVPLSLLVVLPGLLTGLAVLQRRDADRQQAVALSRLVAACAERLRGRDLALSAPIGLVASCTAPTAEAREALMDASALPAVTRILAFRGVVQAVVLSPDGHTLAAGSRDHPVALWDLRDPQRPPPLGVAPVTFPRPE
ncbi:WD40 repeat domain-containing protein [Streptomyces lavendulae]|uniref:WD40 repeat domain-containing protein n=1 Tax=Streptomyces lavendulae TaxID=1914 RepID=UPI0036A245AB